MDFNSFLSPRMMVGAAVVGLVSAAGVFIYEQVYAEKRRSMLVNEVARLDKQLNSMRTELETLRELQKEAELRRQKHKKSTQTRRTARQQRAAPAGDVVDAPAEQSFTSDSEYFTDYQSVLASKPPCTIPIPNEMRSTHICNHQSMNQSSNLVRGDVVDAPAEQSYTSDSEYFTDYRSVLSTDAEMDSEEFYDVHTDDDDTLQNGHDSDATLDDDASQKTDSTKSSPRKKSSRK